MRTPVVAVVLLLLVFFTLGGCGGGSGSSGGAVADSPGAGTVGGGGTVAGGGSTSGSTAGAGATDTGASTSVAKLSWNATQEGAVGYKVYYGTAPGSYATTVDVGLVQSYSLSGLPPGTYYFAVTAYDASGYESPLSNEASKTIS